VNTGGTPAGANAPSPAEVPGASPIGATVGLPPEPLAAAGIGGQEGNPLSISPFPPGQVPGFFIETYRVPPLLLGIYQSASARYGVPWEVLAAINEVETDYGRDESISSAGAEGWMQFLPQTWAEYGVDATGRGVRDPYNPADAIFAAARYLRAAGAAQSLTGAIFAYNHSSVYVESVMLRARLLAGMPPALLRALTGIGEGHAAGGLTPAQWRALRRRLAQLPQPRVPLTPTGASLPDRPGGVDLPPPPLSGASSLGLFPLEATGRGAVLASAGQAAGGLSFQPELGLPANAVQMAGASASNEVWAKGQIGPVPAIVGGQPIHDTQVLLRHTAQVGWQVVPVLDARGNALSFNGLPAVTAGGGLVLGVQPATPAEQTIVVRDPGGAFLQAPPPGKVLEAGETLYPPTGSARGSSPVLGALDDTTGHTGALIAPAEPSSGAFPLGVLHFDGAGGWTREAICATYAGGGVCATNATVGSLTVAAIAVGSPTNAWLLASSGAEPPKLFQRIVPASGTPVWIPRQPQSWVFGAGPPPTGIAVAPLPNGQMLTVTAKGVWVDAAIASPTVPRGDVAVLLQASTPASGSPPEAPGVLGIWCYPQGACGAGTGSLGGALPEGYESFAWPGAAAGDLGTRIISGLADGALLRMQGQGDFQYIVGGGGRPASGAAFTSSEDGWLSGVAAIATNSAQLVHVTSSPGASQLQSWPAPFRRPLLAIAPAPGSAPGDPGAQALAVGAQGQIARYLPGQGWTPEFLYSGGGQVQEPTLRGVAWPEPGRAYAVGDPGPRNAQVMWLWRADTGLWEPDPAAPLNLHANLTGIAFSPLDPTVGYAVGKQGVLLAYGKTWTQQALPEGLAQANLTSVAFAGGEALASYRMVGAEGHEVGGLIVNEGSGWQIDQGAQALLAGLSNPQDTVLSKVAGLPDGGAVAAGPGVVIERDSPGAPWRFSSQPLPEAQNIAALAAIREGAGVRALVSIDADGLSNPNDSSHYLLGIDDQPAPGFGQPPVMLDPDPLPISGYLLRESAGGWQDLERQAFPVPSDLNNTDLPGWPDAVLGLLVDPAGDQGWAVGGQTGALVEQSRIAGAQFVSQTAAVLRFGAGPPPPQSAGAPAATPGGQVTLAVGGNAQCAAACAGFRNENLGPDAWLSQALSRAAQIPGLRAFLYTGARVATDARAALAGEADAFQREMAAYQADLAAAGSLPVYAAASPSDVDPGGGLSTFTSVLGGDAPAGSVPTGTPAPPPGTGAYALDSTGAGGTVHVIVLDYSTSRLAPGEQGWLAAQLASAKQAKAPAIVMGNADLLDPSAPNYAFDAPAVRQTLLEGGASAYFFDSPERSRAESIGAGSNTIPAFGSGTLGYVLAPPRATEFLGASGFLLASVDVAARDPASNRAPVSVTLEPSISQLALDANDGTLLRRSQVALFQALARRPPAGLELAGAGSSAETAPDPYVPVPDTCQGAACAQFIAPSYSFSSSHPDIGDFVEQDPNNPNPRAVLQGPGGKPIPDSHSGLFCAFNPGTTTVSIQTGGLTYSEQVTVQGGSVEQPCGTVPLVNPPPASANAVATPPPPPPAPAPAGSPTPLSIVPPPPPAPPAPRPPAPKPPAHLLVPPPFFALAAPPVALAAVPVLLPPSVARPLPPSGALFGQAVAPKEEQEDEEAVENARANMAAYSPDEGNVPPVLLLALIVLAAGAGTGIRRVSRSRRARQAPAFARSGASAHNGAMGRRGATERSGATGRSGAMASNGAAARNGATDWSHARALSPQNWSLRRRSP
jgi:hypothetical protein